MCVCVSEYCECVCMQTHIYRYIVCFSKCLQRAGLCTKQMKYIIFFNPSADLMMYVPWCMYVHDHMMYVPWSCSFSGWGTCGSERLSAYLRSHSCWVVEAPTGRQGQGGRSTWLGRESRTSCLDKVMQAWSLLKACSMVGGSCCLIEVMHVLCTKWRKAVKHKERNKNESKTYPPSRNNQS